MNDLIYQFSQQPQTLLTGIGQNIRQIGSQLINQELGRRANEAYTTALTNFSKDTMNEENRLAFLQAAQGVGKFDDTLKVIENMSALAQKNQLKTLAENYSAVLSGNVQLTIDDLEAQALANENDGDDSNNSEAKKLRFFAQQLKDGKITEFLTHHGGIISLFDGGTEVMQNIRDMQAAQIAEGEFALKVMETGFEFEGNQEELDAAIEAGESDPEFGATNLAALNYAKALRGGLEYKPKEFNDTLFSLTDKFQKNANRYFDELAANTTLNDAIDLATNIASKANADPMALGQADIAAINTFQRQIDPATVREGDVHLIQQAESMANRFKLMVAGWTTGAVLSKEQRAAMKELSAKIVEAQKAKVDEVYYPASHASFKRVVREAGRSGDIDELWKEVYSGYTPPGEETEPVTSDVDPNEPNIIKMSPADFFGEN